jgi:cell division transport system permease protein
LIEGVLKGTLGGLLALLLTYVANSLIGKFVFTAEFFDAKYAVAGVAAGALIGLLGSAFSVGRHLKEV